MLPWLIPALFSAGGIGSSFWAQGQRQAQFNRIMNMIKWAQNPQNVLGETTGLYNGMLASPMFTAARNDVFSGAQQAQNSLDARMVGSGVTGGMNSMQQAMGASLPGLRMADLRGNLWNSALGSTQQNIAGRIGVAAQALGQPSGAENIMGSTLAALGPMIQAYMYKNRMGGMRQNPHMFANDWANWGGQDMMQSRW